MKYGALFSSVLPVQRGGKPNETICTRNTPVVLIQRTPDIAFNRTESKARRLEAQLAEAAERNRRMERLSQVFRNLRELTNDRR